MEFKHLIIASVLLFSCSVNANPETLRHILGTTSITVLGDSIQNVIQEPNKKNTAIKTIEHISETIELPKTNQYELVRNKVLDVNRYVVEYKRNKKKSQKMMYGISRCKGYYNIKRIHDFNTYGRYSNFYNVQVDALRRVLPWGQPELRIGLQDGIYAAQFGDKSFENQCKGFYNSEIRKAIEEINN